MVGLGNTSVCSVPLTVSPSFSLFIHRAHSGTVADQHLCSHQMEKQALLPGTHPPQPTTFCTHNTHTHTCTHFRLWQKLNVRLVLCPKPGQPKFQTNRKHLKQCHLNYNATLFDPLRLILLLLTQIKTSFSFYDLCVCVMFGMFKIIVCQNKLISLTKLCRSLLNKSEMRSLLKAAEVKSI